VEVQIEAPEEYQGHAAAPELDTAQQRAWAEACQAIRLAERRDCENEREVVSRSSQGSSFSLEKGTQKVEHSSTYWVRGIVARAQGTGTDRSSRELACRQAMTDACRRALHGASCPLERTVLLSVDGLALGMLCSAGPPGHELLTGKAYEPPQGSLFGPSCPPRRNPLLPPGTP
jgi:hypothetical protein